MNEVKSVNELDTLLNSSLKNGKTVYVKATTLSPKLTNEDGEEYTAETKKTLTSLCNGGYITSIHGISAKVTYPTDDNVSFLNGRLGYITKVKTLNYGTWELKYEFTIK